MPPPDAAAQHYVDQKALAASAASAARTVWADLDPTDIASSWQDGRLSDRLLVHVASRQLIAASRADAYLDAVLAEQNLEIPPLASVRPDAFAGVASDGGSLDTLLFEPAIKTRAFLSAGADTAQAKRTGEAALVRIVVTQVQDAGRSAVGAAIAARPRTGWVRMLVPPSCPRCPVLAGKFFRWNQGFQRHPMCDCQHIPSTESVAGDLTTDPRAAIESGQVTGLSKADTQAIVEDGADPGRVINAHSGMYVADDGRKLTRTLARGGERLRPEQIYRQASDRPEAVRLLRQHGYLVR